MTLRRRGVSGMTLAARFFVRSPFYDGLGVAALVRVLAFS